MTVQLGSGALRLNGGSFDELYVGIREGRKLRYVGGVKAGWVPRTRAAVLDAISAYKISACPFFNLPEEGKDRWGGRSLNEEKMAQSRWVKPTVKVNVAFVEWTEGRKLRHSRFLKLAR